MQWYYLDANQQQIPADESELGTLLQAGTISAETLVWNETMPEWQSAQALWPDWFPAAQAEAQAQAPATRAPVLVAGKAPSIGLVKRPIQSGGGSVTQRTTGGLKTVGKSTGRMTGRGTGKAVEEEEGEVDPKSLIKDLASYLSVHAGWMKFVGVMMIIVGVGQCLTIIGAVIGWLPIWLGVVLNKASNAARSAAYMGSRPDMEEALDRTGFYFKLTGILLLISIIANVLIVVFVISTGVIGAIMGAAAMQGMEGMDGSMPPPDFNQ